MLTSLRVLVAVAFLGNAGAFIYTLVPGARISVRDVWPFLVGALFAFGSMMISLARRSQALYPIESNLPWRPIDVRVFATIPAHAWGVGILGGLVLLLGIALFGEAVGDGVPEYREGKYVLASHGRVIREVTEEEYIRQHLVAVRMLTWIWLLFCWPSLVFFWLGQDRWGCDSVVRGQ